MLKPIRQAQVQFDGFGSIQNELIHEFEKGRHARDVLEALKAPERQRQIARSCGRVERNVDGLGQAAHAIDPYVYWYWRKREGRDIWADKFHKSYMRRHFPETVVRTERNMSRVGFEPGPKRFTKNYGEI